MRYLLLLSFLVVLVRCDSLLLGEEGQVVSLEENLSIPMQMDDGLGVASLVDQFIEEKDINKLIKNIYLAQPNNGLRSMLIARNNKLVIEAYFNGWHRERKQDLRSATKSITSALVGIAIDQQYIASEKEKVFDFFPEYTNFQNWSDEKLQITVEDFLRMRTGLSCNDWTHGSPGNEEKMYKTDDWVKFILDLPVLFAPGENFSYCTGAPVTLGAIIENASNQSIPEFAETNLFSPLGISDYSWEFMPTGRTDTGGHLHLRSRDMMKIGLLFLNEGLWNERQLISEVWINKSTEITGDVRSLGYGYLWWGYTWNIDGNEINTYFANGNGGQYIFVIPSLDAVVVFTGGKYNEDWLPSILGMMSNSILPSFQN